MGQRTAAKLTEEEVQAVARDMVQGRIFTSWQIAPGDANLITAIFMPLGLMERKQILKLQRDKVELFYAPLDAAGPRAINGYPMFFEVSFANQEDAKRIFKVFQTMKGALDGPNK